MNYLVQYVCAMCVKLDDEVVFKFIPLDEETIKHKCFVCNKTKECGKYLVRGIHQYDKQDDSGNKEEVS